MFDVLQFSDSVFALQVFSVGSSASGARPLGIASMRRQNESILEGKDKQSSPVDVNRVLQSNWLAAQKEEIDRKLIAAQNLKKQRIRDEKAAAAQLERTVRILLFLTFMHH